MLASMHRWVMSAWLQNQLKHVSDKWGLKGHEGISVVKETAQHCNGTQAKRNVNGDRFMMDPRSEENQLKISSKYRLVLFSR